MEMIVNAALATVAAHLVLGVILWLRVRKLYSYPGLLGFPVFGNLYYFYKTLFLCNADSQEKFFSSIAKWYGKNGLSFYFFYGFRTSVIVSSPEFVKETAFHPHLSNKPYWMYGAFTTYLNGPFIQTHSDDLWKQKRKEYNTCLKRSRIDRDYYKRFIKSADKLVELIMASSSAVNAHNTTTGVILNNNVDTLFGIETDLVYHPTILNIMDSFVRGFPNFLMDNPSIVEVTSNTLTPCNLRPPTLFTTLMHIGSFFLTNQKLAEVLSTIIRSIDRIIFPKIADLRKLILNETDKRLRLNQCSLSEQPLSSQVMSRCLKYNKSERTLVNELQDLFVTSSHTVTSALSTSIIFLAVLPDFQEIAWKEQYEIFVTDTRDPTIDDIAQMHFLDRFIKETLRFIAPPIIGKLAASDIYINGITIPKGTILIYLLRYMRMDPKYWKNPKVFYPDRFLEDSDTSKPSYLPFGIGIRNCPGMYYAVLLMKVILSKVLRRIKLRTVQKDFRFEDIQYNCSLMTELANPPLLEIEERA